MSHRGPKLRTLADPFVVAPPAGARVRARLRTCDTDATVFRELGTYLGSLANADLAARCRDGNSDAQVRSYSRRFRKQELTSRSSSRWAGAITRTSEDSYQLARRNQIAHISTLRSRIHTITTRLRCPVAGSDDTGIGYASVGQRRQKQCRAQVLAAELARAQAALEHGNLSVCRGGSRLARNRAHLEDAGLTVEQWSAQWSAARLFICADGEKDKAWGNETIRWHPVDHWVEIKLPDPLQHLANRTHGRYRLSTPVTWPHRGDEVAAQADGGALRYDITYHPAKNRWYIDASWKTPAAPILTLEEARRGPVVAIDVNVGHLAVAVLNPDGAPITAPITVPLTTAGLPASTRDARVRAAISTVLALGARHHAGSVVIENLNFERARTDGREEHGNRPSRGKRGRTFRRNVAGIPTAQFRDRLTQMAYHRNIVVIAVDPAYTSRWAGQHWLGTLRRQFNTTELSGHHAASVVIGRRGLDQRARRRGTCVRRPPVDGRRLTTVSAERPTPGKPGLVNPPAPTGNQETGATLGRCTEAAVRPKGQPGETRSRRPKTVRGLPLQHALTLSV